VTEGELVAFDQTGRADFSLLQGFRSANSRMHYLVFDLLVYQKLDLTRLPLIERREIMRSALKFSLEFAFEGLFIFTVNIDNSGLKKTSSKRLVVLRRPVQF
jgi:ATP-dependent DNA ligase